MLSLRFKRKVDHYLGKTLAAFFEVLAFCVGLILRREHSGVPVERAVVMKFSGMGSLACAYPAVAALREAHPGARILFWGTCQTSCLAAELGVFSEIIELDDRTLLSSGYSLVKNLLRIWAFRPQWAFDLETYSKLSSVLCLLTLATNRVGFISETTGFRKYLHTHLVFFNRFQYAGDLYAGMVSDSPGILDGPPAAAPPPRGVPGITADGSVGEMIMININTGELSALRLWPEEKFRSLIERLLDAYPNTIGLIGSEDERERVEALINRLGNGKGRVVNLAGRLSLRELMEHLGGCALFITNDSGPMHLAVLMGAPLVALFGPTHPVHFLPRGRGVEFIYKDYICSPCVHVLDEDWLPCGGSAPCMDSINVDDVCAVVSRALRNRPAKAGRKARNGRSKRRS